MRHTLPLARLLPPVACALLLAAACQQGGSGTPTPYAPEPVVGAGPSPDRGPHVTAEPSPTPEPAAHAPAPGATTSLQDRVRSWVYQLQALDPTALGASGFDLAVIDAADEEGQPWPARTVLTMGQDRLVLAYLSIGEAESYRAYWDRAWDADLDGQPDPGAPPWLAEENPDWEGNYRVRYWDSDWQAIALRALDGIMEAGFDGAYLDIIDGFEIWLGGRPEAAAEMAGFVQTLAGHARGRRAGFLIFPQNGATILSELEPSAAEAYLAAVDGIGAEDTFFYGPDEEDNAYHPQWEVIEHLDRFVEAGKLVLAVDYLTDQAKAGRFYREAGARGYVPYATVRALDRMTVQPR